jgi:hypothetical protein
VVGLRLVMGRSALNRFSAADETNNCMHRISQPLSTMNLMEGISTTLPTTKMWLEMEMLT